MTDAHTKARDVLAQADATASMSAGNPQRTANLILEHGFLREALREHFQFQEGFAQEHRTLVRMVFALLGTVIANSNGRANWMTELPQGTAPAFRRALNDLSTYMRSTDR